MCGAIYTTSLLGRGVRDYQVVTLEEAVRLITDVPARLYGLRHRAGSAGLARRFGAVRPGDRRPRARAHPLRPACRGARLVADAQGISSVWVGGVEVCRDGAATGAMPGTVLRSGRDTDTVTAS
ncbi:D-aminoacylase family protein [Mycobacterium xenopi 3993]|nr:D-aminoacylase family protein [Mycobacterium xenopi 3993]